MVANPLYNPTSIHFPYNSVNDRRQYSNNLVIRRFLEQQSFNTVLFDVVYSISGTINGPQGKSAPLPVVQNLNANYLQMTADLGTPDPDNNMTIAFWRNYPTVTTPFATLVIEAGDSSASTTYQTSEWGNQGDTFQVSIPTYAGSTAADLVVRIQGYHYGGLSLTGP